VATTLHELETEAQPDLRAQHETDGRSPARPGVLPAVYAEHRVLLVVTLAFLASGLLLDSLLWPGAMGELGRQPIIAYAVLLAWCLPLGAPLWYRLRVRDADGARIGGLAGWRAGWALARRRLLSGPRLAGYALAVLSLVLTLQSFLIWKAAIPLIQPFAWDPFFHRLDVALHLGRAPYEWLQPVLGSPQATSAIDFGYHHLWMYLLVGFMVGQAARAPGPDRRQALLSFVLMWILLGTVAAIVFASAGPVYYDRVLEVGVGGPYAPLMDYLADAERRTGPLSALRIQEFLWTGYAAGGRPFGTGISAFPSLHIASTAWFALCVGRASRRWAAALWGMTAFMLIGSVHLGWHYAVDGYAALLAMIGIWWCCGRLAREPRNPAGGEVGA